MFIDSFAICSVSKHSERAATALVFFFLIYLDDNCFAATLSLLWNLGMVLTRISRFGTNQCG
jgi:hypothetical protein